MLISDHGLMGVPRKGPRDSDSETHPPARRPSTKPRGHRAAHLSPIFYWRGPLSGEVWTFAASVLEVIQTAEAQDCRV